MKYIALIHANPQPWGHPVEAFLPEFQQLPAAEQARCLEEFEGLLTRLAETGELVGGEALGDPADASIYNWDNGSATKSDGPYAETKEHLAGYFLLDVDSQARAQEIASGLAGPGQVIELRPLHGQNE